MSIELEEYDFKVLGFPSNEFNQETGTNEEILEFAQDHNAEGRFALFAKLTVNSECTSSESACAAESAECCPLENPIYEYLKSVLPGKISWNFNKFLVGADGVPTKRYGAGDLYSTLRPDIYAALGVDMPPEAPPPPTSLTGGSGEAESDNDEDTTSSMTGGSPGALGSSSSGAAASPAGALLVAAAAGALVMAGVRRT